MILRIRPGLSGGSPLPGSSGKAAVFLKAGGKMTLPLYLFF